MGNANHMQIVQFDRVDISRPSPPAVAFISSRDPPAVPKSVDGHIQPAREVRLMALSLHVKSCPRLSH